MKKYEEMNTSYGSENIEEPQINYVPTDDIQHSTDAESTSCFKRFSKVLGITGRPKSEKKKYKSEKLKYKLQKLIYETEKIKYESEESKYKSKKMKYEAKKVKHELEYVSSTNVASSPNVHMIGSKTDAYTDTEELETQSLDINITNLESKPSYISGKKPDELNVVSRDIQTDELCTSVEDILQNFNMNPISGKTQSTDSTEQTSYVSSYFIGGNFKIILGYRFIQKELTVSRNSSTKRYSCICLVGTEGNINSLESFDTGTSNTTILHILKITRNPHQDHIIVFTPETNLTEQQWTSFLQKGFTENDLASCFEIKTIHSNGDTNSQSYFRSSIGTSITDTQDVERKLDPAADVSKHSAQPILSTFNETYTNSSYSSNAFSANVSNHLNYTNTSKQTNKLHVPTIGEKSLLEIQHEMPAKQYEEHHISCITTKEEMEGIVEIPSKSAQVRKKFPISPAKVRNSIVKHKSTKMSQTPYVLTPRDKDTLGSLINKVFQDDSVRKLVEEFFSNDMKTHFERPSVPWPSMHPLLPYKLRYLDNTVDHIFDESTRDEKNEDDVSDSSDS